MSSLYLLRASALGMLCAVFYLVSAGQTIHACFMATRGRRGESTLNLCLEVAVVIHLVLGCATANSAMENYGVIVFLAYPFILHVELLLWANALAAALALAVAWKDGRPAAIADAVVLACCTPPAIDALGSGAAALFVIDASYFTARTVALLAFDARAKATMVTRLSIVDALDTLPEGVLWLGPGGGVMFMNDAMRATLTSLGLATDLADARGLWDELAQRAGVDEDVRDAATDVAARKEDAKRTGKPPSVRRADDRFMLETPAGRTCLFVRDRVVMRRRLCERIMAFDMTEEATLNARLASANRLLEAANDELRDSVAQVRKIAEDEAALRMRTRMHDTMGSRLSILHRYLEDGSDDPETLSRVTDLLSHIDDDLSAGSHAEGTVSLDPICRAFSLVGMDVRVAGTLPSDLRLAATFRDIVLEAVTNAAKHAQAHRVDVTIGRADDGALRLTVSNDGAAPERVVEGSGIAGMRRAAQRVGARLAIRATWPFTVEVVVPANVRPGDFDEGGQM